MVVDAGRFSPCGTTRLNEFPPEPSATFTAVSPSNLMPAVFKPVETGRGQLAGLGGGATRVVEVQGVGAEAVDGHLARDRVEDALARRPLAADVDGVGALARNGHEGAGRRGLKVERVGLVAPDDGHVGRRDGRVDVDPRPGTRVVAGAGLDQHMGPETVAPDAIWTSPPPRRLTVPPGALKVPAAADREARARTRSSPER